MRKLFKRFINYIHAIEKENEEREKLIKQASARFDKEMKEGSDRVIKNMACLSKIERRK